MKMKAKKKKNINSNKHNNLKLKMNFYNIFKAIASLLSAALIVYIIVSQVDTLIKIAWVNFIVHVTAQLYLYNKKQLKIPNLSWFFLSLILLSAAVLRETGKI